MKWPCPQRMACSTRFISLGSQRVPLFDGSSLLRLLPVIAHVLAWIAFAGVVLWPFGYSVTTRTELSGGMVRFAFGHAPGPFMQYLGPLDVMLLLPVGLTGLAVWLLWPLNVRPARAKPALWALGVLCLVYCSVPIWFIEQVDII